MASRAGSRARREAISVREEITRFACIANRTPDDNAAKRSLARRVMAAEKGGYPIHCVTASVCQSIAPAARMRRAS